MIKKILSKLGYIHEDEVTEDYLCSELAKYIGDPRDYEFPKDEELKLFKSLSNIDNYSAYLRYTSAKDMERYMSAPNEKQRDIVRGAFMRTNHMRAQLSKPNTDTKINGLRYK